MGRVANDAEIHFPIRTSQRPSLPLLIDISSCPSQLSFSILDFCPWTRSRLPLSRLLFGGFPSFKTCSARTSDFHFFHPKLLQRCSPSQVCFVLRRSCPPLLLHFRCGGTKPVRLDNEDAHVLRTLVAEASLHFRVCRGDLLSSFQRISHLRQPVDNFKRNDI